VRLFQQFVEVALKTFLFAGYLFLYSHWRLFEIPSTLGGGLVGASSARTSCITGSTGRATR
jgi:hypothetical protein